MAMMGIYVGRTRRSTTNNGTSRDSYIEYNHKGSSIHKDQKRLLVKINVIGSAGPLKVVVNEKDAVGKVIEAALKLYAKEGRLPLLGCDPTKFLLYCANSKATSHALRPWDNIGSCGARKFVLFKKPDQFKMGETKSSSSMVSRMPSWRTWLYKSLILKAKILPLFSNNI